MRFNRLPEFERPINRVASAEILPVEPPEHLTGRNNVPDAMVSHVRLISLDSFETELRTQRRESRANNNRPAGEL